LQINIYKNKENRERNESGALDFFKSKKRSLALNLLKKKTKTRRAENSLLDKRKKVLYNKKDKMVLRPR
jgi:hypothetical protein